MAAERQSPNDDDGLPDLSEFTAREPDNYAEAFRQREILKISSDVGELFQRTKYAMEEGEIDEPGRQSIIRSGVERLIIDVEQIVKAVNGRSILDAEQGTKIHEVKLPPPEEIYHVIHSKDVRVLGNPDISPKLAEGGVIRGLWGYLNAPEVFNASWTVRIEVRHKEPQPFTRPNNVRMPVKASQEAYRVVREFLADVELDLGPNLPDYMGEEGPGI